MLGQFATALQPHRIVHISATTTNTNLLSHHQPLSTTTKHTVHMSLSRDDARNRLRPFGIVFEKSLTDLIRGIRAAKDIQAREKFLRDAIAECRSEVASPDMEVKTQAVLKLAYLEMYGFDMSWAAFHVLEVMSSPKFQQKRVGYLAAIQSFKTTPMFLCLRQTC